MDYPYLHFHVCSTDVIDFIFGNSDAQYFFRIDFLDSAPVCRCQIYLHPTNYQVWLANQPVDSEKTRSIDISYQHRRQTQIGWRRLQAATIVL